MLRDPGPSPGSAALCEYLGANDVRCPECGHSLRGLLRPRCPECGFEFERWLAQAAAHREWRKARWPYDRVFAAGISGAILGLGWAILAVVLAALVVDQRSAGALRLVPLAVAVPGLLAQAGYAWVYMSARNIAPRVKRRVLLAVGAWVLGPVTLCVAAVLAVVVAHVSGAWH